MDRAIVTFYDPKEDRKIIINITHDDETQNIDLKVNIEPKPVEGDTLGLIAFLSEIFIEKLSQYGKSPDESYSIEDHSR